MKIRCDYCGNMIEETEGICPSCGASLSGVNRMADGQPKTIIELKQWYIDHNLPPEYVTRFFIGKNITEPKAFGIYKDENGDFVVYKNKADGSRAVRYQGSDEAYATNELYQRLKTEIANQKSLNASRRSIDAGAGISRSIDNGGRKFRNKRPWYYDPQIKGFVLTIGILLLVFLFCFFIYLHNRKLPSRGYYRYNDTDYYYQNSSWYVYDRRSNDWNVTDSSDSIYDEINAENDQDYRIYNHKGTSFESTSWYRDSSDSDSNWDSGSSWDSNDSWDSGGTDWGSDW